MEDADVGRGEVDYPPDLCVPRRIMRSAVHSPMHMSPRCSAVKNELIIRWIWVFNHHRCFANCDFAPLTGANGVCEKNHPLPANKHITRKIEDSWGRLVS